MQDLIAAFNTVEAKIRLNAYNVASKKKKLGE
jgi:hypothetical protein